MPQRPVFAGRVLLGLWGFLIVGFVLVSFMDTSNGPDAAPNQSNATFVPMVSYADFNPPQETIIAHQEDSPGEVLFDHTTHTDLGEPACVTCHSGTYTILGSGAAKSDWSQIDFHDKSHCGRCHDGEEAFDLEDDEECSSCHME
jgi:c(7)-type cytochrome triheme protein